MKGLPHYELDHAEQVLVHISVDDEGEPSHDHGFYELMAVLSGSGIHWINGDVYKVVPGDVFLLNMGDMHYLTPSDSATQFRWIVLGWSPAFFTIEDRFLLENKKFAIQNSSRISNLLLDALYEFNLKLPEYHDVIRHELMAILTMLKRSAEEPEVSYNGRHRENLVKRAINYIHENYSQPMSLRSIAEYLDISEVYLCKLFSKEVGVGAIQYLRKIRIERAAELLRTTDKKVGRIATEVGFRDAKSFHTMFKSQMGVTPAAYREHCRKSPQGRPAE